MKAVLKRASAVLTALAFVGAMAACSSQRSGSTESESTESAPSGSEAVVTECAFEPDSLVGVVMPTKSLERWNRDGEDLKNLLENAGLTVDLQFADNKVDIQISQLENMINAGAKVLVVASIDGEALGPVLETAAQASIPVIAYDRLIMGTEAVDYYATFDNYKIGAMQGAYIEEALDLANADGPFNLEMVAGSPDDNNAYFYFGGAWDQLGKYYEDGTLVVPSGKVPADKDDWQSIGIQGWDGAKVQSEMENRLNTFYQDKKVDAVLSPNDSLALGIAEALSANGYVPGTDWPILTGQDADVANVLNMLDGKQSMTVWVDTRELGKRVATMVEEIVACEEVEVNDTNSYDNGLKKVPSYLLDPVVVTEDNIEETLVESGFYDKSELGL